MGPLARRVTELLGGRYVASTETMSYDLPRHGQAVAFLAEPSPKTYALDLSLLVAKATLDAMSAVTRTASWTA